MEKQATQAAAAAARHDLQTSASKTFPQYFAATGRAMALQIASRDFLIALRAWKHETASPLVPGALSPAG